MHAAARDYLATIPSRPGRPALRLVRPTPRDAIQAEPLIKRFEQAKTEAQLWFEQSREAYEYVLPQRNILNWHAPGQKKIERIYDSTPIFAARTFASRIQSLLMPSGRNWGRLVAGSMVPKDDRRRIDSQLEEITDTVFRYLRASNVATEVNESLLDLSIGTGPLLLQDGGDEQPLQFKSQPLANVYIEAGPWGSVRTVFREREVALRNLSQEWPAAQWSDLTMAAAVKDGGKKVVIIEGMVFDPARQVYHNVVIELKQEHLAQVLTDEVASWMVPRWMVVANEVYGRGPAMAGLPDIKTLNDIKKLIMQNAAISVAGMWKGTDDGIFNPNTVVLGPGAIIPLAQMDNMEPLERAGDFQVGDIVLKDLQDAVRKHFLAQDAGGAVDGPVKSATEWILRTQELERDAGPSFGRLGTELVVPIVSKVVDILRRRGLIPDIRLDGREVSFRFEGPLAQAQDQDDVMTLQNFLEIGNALGPELMMQGIKMEDVPKYLADKLGVPASLVRDDAERAKLAEQVQEAAAMAQGGGEVPGAPGQAPAAIPGVEAA